MATQFAMISLRASQFDLAISISLEEESKIWIPSSKPNLVSFKFEFEINKFNLFRFTNSSNSIRTFPEELVT